MNQTVASRTASREPQPVRPSAGLIRFTAVEQQPLPEVFLKPAPRDVL